jgi:hypothetical protein
MIGSALRGLILRVMGQPGRPKPGEAHLYVSQTDRKLHLVDDRGTDTALGGAGSGSSPLTTKGDLYTRNGSADARLGAGIDGYVLTADSAETTGLKWAAASGGSGLTHPQVMTRATFGGF